MTVSVIKVYYPMQHSENFNTKISAQAHRLSITIDATIREFQYNFFLPELENISDPSRKNLNFVVAQFLKK
jgi:hypothetical protein